MTEMPKIRALSELSLPEARQGSAVVMVGSFAPIHDGHFDALHSASNALTHRGALVESLILTPNSEEYLNNKLADESNEWPYERRINFIRNRIPHLIIPTYVDDVSGRLAKEKQINNFVPGTIQRQLGFNATQLYFVVGSDQLLSMEEHLTANGRAVCVLRPGNMDEIQDQMKIRWIAEANQSERLIITERSNMQHDVSSTAIRKSTERHKNA